MCPSLCLLVSVRVGGGSLCAISSDCATVNPELHNTAQLIVVKGAARVRSHASPLFWFTLPPQKHAGNSYFEGSPSAETSTSRQKLKLFRKRSKCSFLSFIQLTKVPRSARCSSAPPAGCRLNLSERRATGNLYDTQSHRLYIWIWFYSLNDFRK